MFVVGVVVRLRNFCFLTSNEYSTQQQTDRRADDLCVINKPPTVAHESSLLDYVVLA